MKALILGGVKSGKSRHAEALANEISDSVTLIATAELLDQEMKARIERHQKDRPSHWKTVESPIALGQTLDLLHSEEVVVIDCLTLWLTNLLMKDNKKLMDLELVQFEESVSRFPNALIMVSNETSLGIMPMGELSRKFLDYAGLLHQDLAKLCDRVELIVAGLPLPLKHEISV